MKKKTHQSETHPNPPCLGREPYSIEGNNKKSSLSREDIGGSLPYKVGVGLLFLFILNLSRNHSPKLVKRSKTSFGAKR